MVGLTLSHYRIIEELSRGGMGIVYRAVDLKLDRQVAIKVLPPELVADPERRRRFVQEAKAAAALEHPHIAVIYEIDEADGLTFIAMELIRGQKLRDLLAQERLPAVRALDLAVEVAEGLARAHDRGIVHRDLKPANIMLTEDDHAKIIDFGLAKLVEPLSGSDSELETLLQKETEPGIILGTVAYMSPEQARAGKVDHRSDIFTFGAVLQEMLTGQNPFQRGSALDTLHAVAREPAPRIPPPGPEVSAEAAHELQRLLDKCLAKQANDRYQGMKDLVVDLRVLRRRLESGSVAAPVPPAARRWSPSGIAVLLVLLVVAGFLLWRKPWSGPRAPLNASRPSVAVLYFENISGDPSLDWLRAGLTDMLVTDLSQSPQIEVLGTDRLYQILKELNRLDERITSLDVVQQVAQKAGSQTVILGSFMKAGDQIRINLRVQEARSGRILATEKVEGVGESSLFPMVDDLTRRIKTRFELPATADAELDRDLKDVTTSSVEAYRYYAEGIQLFERMNQEEAIPHFEKAIAVDPGFAMALAKLAAIHANLGHTKESLEYRKRAFEHVDRLTARERYYVEGHYYWTQYETYRRSMEAFKKAVEIYPDHGSARHNLAFQYQQQEQYDQAIEHYRTLVQRGDVFPATHSALAECYSARGEMEKGHQVLRDFVSRNPESWYGHNELGLHLMRWGKLDEALEAFDKAESLGPGKLEPHEGRWELSVLREDWAKADAAAEKLTNSDDPFWNWLGSFRKALMQLYRGKSRDAVGSIRKGMRASAEPGFTSTVSHAYIANILLGGEQFATALREAEEARRLGQGRWPELWSLFPLALAQARLGRWTEAEKTAEELKEKSGLLPGERWKRYYHHLAGEMALLRGENERAIGEMQRADALLSLRAFFGGALGVPAPHVPIWFSLGSACLATGDDERAAQYFRRIVESTTERIEWPIPYVRSFFFLGKIHEKRGESEKARDHYRRFVNFWKDGDLDRQRLEEAKRKI